MDLKQSSELSILGQGMHGRFFGWIERGRLQVSLSRILPKVWKSRVPRINLLVFCSQSEAVNLHFLEKNIPMDVHYPRKFMYLLRSGVYTVGTFSYDVGESSNPSNRFWKGQSPWIFASYSRSSIQQTRSAAKISARQRLRKMRQLAGG